MRNIILRRLSCRRQVMETVRKSQQWFHSSCHANILCARISLLSPSFSFYALHVHSNGFRSDVFIFPCSPLNVRNIWNADWMWLTVTIVSALSKRWHTQRRNELWRIYRARQWKQRMNCDKRRETGKKCRKGKFEMKIIHSSKFFFSSLLSFAFCVWVLAENSKRIVDIECEPCASATENKILSGWTLKIKFNDKIHWRRRLWWHVSCLLTGHFALYNCVGFVGGDYRRW